MKRKVILIIMLAIAVLNLSSCFFHEQSENEEHQGYRHSHKKNGLKKVEIFNEDIEHREKWQKEESSRHLNNGHHKEVKTENKDEQNKK